MKRYIKSSEDMSSKYVIVDQTFNDLGREGRDYGQLFIGSTKGGYGNHTYYSPTFTSTRANNYSRAKLFNSLEDAENFIESQGKQKDLWKYTQVTVMPYEEAMAAIGDPDKNYADYKQKQADDRKAYSKQYQERAKLRNEQNKIQDPGTYKVWFNYANSWLGGESFTVDAESVDDAFKKAKEKALRQDQYRNASGYDQRMIFNKNSIKKVS